MQIKEAAARSALTERAVRLYEERGLISPHIENKNGRDFRDYSERDLERLKIISALRRALFTIDEIKEMLDDPSKIEGITETNKRRIHADFLQLSYLNARMEAVEASLIADAGELSRAIFAPDSDKSSPVTVPDEAELYSEEYRRIYDKYFAENTGWDRRYGASLRIAEVLESVGRFFSRRAVIIGIVIIAALAIIVNIPRTETVEYTYTGVELDRSELFTVELSNLPADVTVTVHGKYKYYLFRKTQFEGYLETTRFRNASSPGEPGRFSFVCSFPPLPVDADPNRDPYAVFFDIVGWKALILSEIGEPYKGCFDDPEMNVFIIQVPGKHTPNDSFIILSRTGDMERAEAVLESFRFLNRTP